MAWTDEEKFSFKITIGLTFLVFIIAIFSFYINNILWIAISVGALGGILHEIIQSDGKIVLPTPKTDGVYLGAVYGLIVGAAVGVLSIQSMPETTVDISRSLIIQIFSAGLAFKGISDAAAGRVK
ncbi:MAG: DUF4257 domain-containing protein [Candidatus Methanoperedens sp.]|nr:DUF4257 domain-containing protein [Candidatus Methanoperedens sp.]